MSSPKRRRDRPIESVSLKLTFMADKGAFERVRKKVPSAVLKDGKCEVVIGGEAPAEVAKKAKKVLEAVSQSKRL